MSHTVLQALKDEDVAGPHEQQRLACSRGKKRQRTEDSDARVTHSELRCSMLLKCRRTDQYVLVGGSLPCPLQTSDRVTAETLHSMHKEVYEVPGLSDGAVQGAFKRVAVCHTADSCSANQRMNKRARQEDVEERPRKRRRLNLPCNVHKTQTVKTYQYDAKF